MIEFDDPIELLDIHLVQIPPEPPIPKRYLRDSANPLEFYTDLEFRIRFRFCKNYVTHGIFPLISFGLDNNNNRGLPIPPMFQLLICLRYYATNCFQRVSGDLVQINQSTVSNIICRVSLLIAALFDRYVKMPNSQAELDDNRELFSQLGADNENRSFRNVDGVIDCTHISLKNVDLGRNREIYRNRKGYFSLNVQAVVGPRLEILDLVHEWPGSEHDSRIFQNSRSYVRLTEGEFGGTLVGDAGYPSLAFLLTPVDRPRTHAERSYNGVLVKTRRIVERLFGVWKREFPVLDTGLRTKIFTSMNIVAACAVVHNMRLISANILANPGQERNEARVMYPPPRMIPGEGLLVRRHVIERIFG